MRAPKDVCVVEKALASEGLVWLRRRLSEPLPIALRFIMCSRYMDAKPLGRAWRSLIALCKSLLKEQGASQIYVSSWK